MTTTLAVHEQQRLQSLEATIRQGLKQFYAVGAALLEIRESRLYRATHPTFADYCRERWDMEDRRANQIIEAASVRKNFTETLPPPPVESQARELAKLPPEQQADAYREAVAESNGKPTAKDIKAVANRRLGKPEPAVPPGQPANTVGELSGALANLNAPGPASEAEAWEAEQARQERLAAEREAREAAEAEAATTRGRTRVNGVEQDDPKLIARLRAAGVVTGEVVIDEPEPVATAHPHPDDGDPVGPHAGELPDEDAEPTKAEWLDALPLATKLVGQQLKTYRRDAGLYYDLRAVRKAYQAGFRDASKANARANRGSVEGHYESRLGWCLRTEDPTRWLICPPHDKGGCAGTGQLLTKECPECKGRGYIL